MTDLVQYFPAALDLAVEGDPIPKSAGRAHVIS
jgi:hypothetical protein